METKLLYLEDFSLLSCDAKVAAVVRENEKDIIVLDATVFYPQGGGQPYDTGAIQSPSGKCIVEEVRFLDGVVRHIGHFEHGAFAQGERVECRVDEERRALHSGIHSAGHLIDMAVSALRPAWTPDPRGYHYPNGPYVTYAGSLENTDKEKLKTDIEQFCRHSIAEKPPVSIRFMNRDEMRSFCRSVPDLPEGKPGRVIMFGGNFGVLPLRQNPGEFLTLARATHGSLNSPVKLHFTPCGGTHVKNLSEIRGLAIRKIKQEGANIRIGYDVAR